MVLRVDKPKPFKPSEQQKTQVAGFIDKWKPLLFLHEWPFTMKYSPTADPNEAGKAATIRADCTYKLATITIFPCFFEEDAVTREHVILHELCHCVTMIMKEPAYAVLVEEKHVSWHQFKEADERCTQQLTNIIFELYRQRKTL